MSDAVRATDVDAAALAASSTPVDRRVLDGEVLVVRGLLQQAQMLDAVNAASLAAIEQVVGKAAADRVRSVGFERLHEIVSMADITKATEAGYEHHARLTPELARRLVAVVFGPGRTAYVEQEVNVRYTVPYARAVENRKELDQFRWNGKITAHGPHHDSWYACPTNCVNIWIAVSPVTVGNGLTIYPAMHGKRLPCDDQGRIRPGQYFQGAVNFEMQPGDAIVFHGDHLHASELNWTDATRLVVSLRLTIDKPEYIGASGFAHEYMQIRPGTDWRSRLLERGHELRRRASKRAAAVWHKTRWGRPHRDLYFIPTDDPSVFHDTAPDFPSVVPVASLEPGEVRAISADQCAARTDDGELVVVRRRCPHQGADLAGGYLRDGALVCPWHNLPFDLQTGASPCTAIRSLELASAPSD